MEIIGETPGPGTYTASEELTKTRVPQVIIQPGKDLNLSPTRGTDGGVGPGTYEDNK